MTTPRLGMTVPVLGAAGGPGGYSDQVDAGLQIIDENSPLSITTFGGKGDDGVTNNSGPLQDALDENDGRVYYPPATGIYVHQSPASVAGGGPVQIFGPGGVHGGVGPDVGRQMAYVRYAGADARFIDARSTLGFDWWGLTGDATNAGFTGPFIDLSHGGAATDSQNFTVRDCALFLPSGATGVLMDQALNGLIQRVNLVGGARGLDGGSTYSNANRVYACRFSGQHDVPIFNPIEGWDIVATFEPRSDGSAGAIRSDTRVEDLRAFLWCGDANNTGDWVNLYSLDNVTIGGLLASAARGVVISGVGQASSVLRVIGATGSNLTSLVDVSAVGAGGSLNNSEIGPNFLVSVTNELVNGATPLNAVRQQSAGGLDQIFGNKLSVPAGIITNYTGALTPTGGYSGEIRVGAGKIWVNDNGTWKSAVVA